MMSFPKKHTLTRIIHENCLNGAPHRMVTVFTAVLRFHLLSEKFVYEKSFKFAKIGL